MAIGRRFLTKAGRHGPEIAIFATFVGKGERGKSANMTTGLVREERYVNESTGTRLLNCAHYFLRVYGVTARDW